MLALRTGWTPDVIGGDAPGGVTDRFRRAAHFALYAERLAPFFDDAQRDANTFAPEGAPMDAKVTYMQARVSGQARETKIRELLGMTDG